jgi:hypothetical protein
MDKSQFALMLSSIISEVSHELSQRYQISEMEASHLFYTSQVYQLLEKESTKMWHLSYMTLCMLYEDEINTGHIDIPEEL